MQAINWTDHKVAGELYSRTILNYDRLETAAYRYPNIFREGDYSWPGDWEGRTILALTMLAQSTGREPLYLEEIMLRLPERLNAKGFFGTIYPEGTADEQQLSGHSWLLRAMAEHHSWKGDELSLLVVENIVRHLLLPVRGLYERYPLEADARGQSGEAIGSLQARKVGDWLLSSDVGCAFIMLDGASQAYQLLKWPELGELIDEMIDKFRTIDWAGLSFQTHATLSALRGILRHYDTTGEAPLLELARSVFNLYIRDGITENYANYNWFGRPEWTEPCAVVDSFISAVELWKHTEEAAYLDIAEGILYNGLGYGQRPNGGFGCDSCSGAYDDFVHPKNGLFEAYWCCTMRGGDGLSRAIGYSYFTDADRNVVMLPFLQRGKAVIRLAAGSMTLAQTTAYPLEGTFRLEVNYSDIGRPVTVRWKVPSWAEQSKIAFTVNSRREEPVLTSGFAEWTGVPCAGTVLEMAFPIEPRWSGLLNAGSLPARRGLYHGALMLGIDAREAYTDSFELFDLALESAGEAVYRIRDSRIRMRPIRSLANLTTEQAEGDRRQVLFRAY